MSKIAILGDYEQVYTKSSFYSILTDQGHEITIHDKALSNAEDVIHALQDVEIAVLMRERTRLTKDILTRLPKLSLISQTGKGLNHIDQVAAKNQNIDIFTTEGVSSQSVVELTIGLMIGCARQFPLHQINMAKATWLQTPGIELKGKRLGLIGFGNIGKGVSKVANSLGMEVVAWRPRGVKGNEKRDYDVEILELDDVIATSDVLSLHLRLLPEFQNLLNKDKLSRLKKGAILINTSRGELIDERALAELLEEGHLLGAGIDTFTEEPLIDNPFVHRSNTILTPHIGYITYDVLTRFADASLKNVIEWLHNKMGR